jgi:hypothetical protein
VILEDGVIEGFHYTRILGGIRQLGVVLTHFRPKNKTALILDFLFIGLVAKFLPPRLHSKIGLPSGNRILRRVRVLDSQVTGIP